MLVRATHRRKEMAVAHTTDLWEMVLQVMSIFNGFLQGTPMERVVKDIHGLSPKLWGETTMPSQLYRVFHQLHRGRPWAPCARNRHAERWGQAGVSIEYDVCRWYWSVVEVGSRWKRAWTGLNNWGQSSKEMDNSGDKWRRKCRMVWMETSVRGDLWQKDR